MVLCVVLALVVRGHRLAYMLAGSLIGDEEGENERRESEQGGETLKNGEDWEAS